MGVRLCSSLRFWWIHLKPGESIMNVSIVDKDSDEGGRQVSLLRIGSK